MYTTLDFLKQNSACKDGYSQMIQFFGTARKMMHVPLPLGLCSMVLKPGDFKWMLENALIVDEEQFAAFRRKWLLSLFQTVVWNDLGMSSGTECKAMRPYLQQARDATTYEQVNAVIEMCKYVVVRDFSLYGFDDDYPNPWDVPTHFIRAGVQRLDVKWGSDRREYHNDNLPEGGKRLSSYNHGDIPYFFGWKEKPIVAQLFEDEPYKAAVKFLSDHPEISRKALKTKLSFIDEKPQMTFTLDDPKRIFNTYRILSDSSEQAMAALAAAAREEERENEDEDEEEEED